MNYVLENLNDVFSCLFGNERFVVIVGVDVDISLTARAVTAAVRPDTVAVTAAEAALEITAFVLCAAAKIGRIKIRAVCTAMTAVGNLCTVGTGALGCCSVSSDYAEAD